ncbi:predicted glycosyltransferase [Moesziomyces antarcticus T-34]|uniref:UDP-N-acetylglucosamine transferase subunit ALG13 n=1 Tax=Pseudozyma antarctica (strain T-34) TaxID=1151754 RepID=M9LMJ0_PSEA3|nr:predicted glycosyltransferase [Moesziomyces antarcticus T-34]
MLCGPCGEFERSFLAAFHEQGRPPNPTLLATHDRVDELLTLAMTAADVSASAASPKRTQLAIFVTVGTTRFDSLVRAVVSQRFLRALARTFPPAPGQDSKHWIKLVVQYGTSPISDILTAMDAASVDAGSEIVPEPGLRIVNGRRVYQSGANIPGLDPGQTGTLPGMRIRTAANSMRQDDPRGTVDRMFDSIVQEAKAVAGTSSAATTASQQQNITVEAELDCGVELQLFAFAPDLKSYIESADVVISHAGSGTILDTLRVRPHPPALVVVPNTSLMDNHQVELAEALGNDGFLTVGSEDSLIKDVARARQATHAPFPDFDPARFTSLVDQVLLL